MTPTEQRLRSDDPPRGKVHLGLILDKELAARDCMAQTVLQRHPLQRLGIQVRGKEAPAASAILLGTAQRQIGFLQQAFRVRAMLREQADPDAAGRTQRVSLNPELFSDDLPDSLGGNGCFGAVPDSS